MQCKRHATQPTSISSVFFISVEPTNSTGKILRRLRSLEVKIRPNCLGRFWNPPTERPERQLHS